MLKTSFNMFYSSVFVLFCSGAFSFGSRLKYIWLTSTMSQLLSFWSSSTHDDTFIFSFTPILPPRRLPPERNLLWTEVCFNVRACTSVAVFMGGQQWVFQS